MKLFLSAPQKFRSTAQSTTLAIPTWKCGWWCRLRICRQLRARAGPRPTDLRIFHISHPYGRTSAEKYISIKISRISFAAVRPSILPLWSKTFLYLNVEVWFLTMLNIEILKDYCQISAQSYKKCRSYIGILKFSPILPWKDEQQQHKCYLF